MVELIIEDGTGSPVANSYVTLAEVKAYVEQTSKPLTNPDEDIIRSIIAAARYMECITRFKGSRQTVDQALQFPRKGLRDGDGNSLDGVIPVAIKRAQCQLVQDSFTSGQPLLSNAPTYALKRRTLGPLTQEWATGSGQVTAPTDPHTMFWAYLEDYLRGGNVGGRVIR